jgi:hypothetical protein
MWSTPCDLDLATDWRKDERTSHRRQISEGLAGFGKQLADPTE